LRDGSARSASSAARDHAAIIVVLHGRSACIAVTVRSRALSVHCLLPVWNALRPRIFRPISPAPRTIKPDLNTSRSGLPTSPVPARSGRRARPPGPQQHKREATDLLQQIGHRAAPAAAPVLRRSLSSLLKGCAGFVLLLLGKGGVKHAFRSSGGTPIVRCGRPHGNDSFA